MLGDRQRRLNLPVLGAYALLTSAPVSADAASPSPSIMQIGAGASGVVDQILVHDGDHVAFGQILLKLNCRPLEAEISVRAADLAASEAVAERTRNGPRPDEVAIGVAGVGVAQARAEEAQAAYQRATALREGITTLALILQAKRDARITAAQLEDARKKLDLLHAGSRAEDIAEANARRDAARATLEETKARLDQCTVRAPAEGMVKILATLGQFVSTAVPVTLVQLQSGAKS